MQNPSKCNSCGSVYGRKVNETKMEAFSITDHNEVAFCSTNDNGSTPLKK